MSINSYYINKESESGASPDSGVFMFFQQQELSSQEDYHSLFLLPKDLQ